MPATSGLRQVGRLQAMNESSPEGAQESGTLRSLDQMRPGEVLAIDNRYTVSAVREQWEPYMSFG